MNSETQAVHKIYKTPEYSRRAVKKWNDAHREELNGYSREYMKTCYLLNKERLNKRRAELNRMKKQQQQEDQQLQIHSVLSF